jgi:hypothetical protein
MRKRYKLIRVPEEAYYGFNKKKVILESILKEELRKEKRVTFADTLRFFSQKPTFVFNQEFVNFYKKKKPSDRRSKII